MASGIADGVQVVPKPENPPASILIRGGFRVIHDDAPVDLFVGDLWRNRKSARRGKSVVVTIESLVVPRRYENTKALGTLDLEDNAIYVNLTYPRIVNQPRTTTLQAHEFLDKFEPVKARQDLEKSKEAVNHPEHYNEHPSGVECIQVVEHMNFNLGNAVKYIWRASLKGKLIEDLKKARWYLDREIQRLEKE